MFRSVDSRENNLHSRQKCMIGSMPIRKDRGLDRHGRYGRISENCLNWNGPGMILLKMTTRTRELKR